MPKRVTKRRAPKLRGRRCHAARLLQSAPGPKAPEACLSRKSLPLFFTLLLMYLFPSGRLPPKDLWNCGVPGGVRRDAVAPPFSLFRRLLHQISWTNLGSIVHGLFINCWKVFLLMYLPCSRPIFGRISFRISYCFAFLLFRRTLGDTYSTVEFAWFSYMHLFQKLGFFMRSNSENYRNAGLFSHHFSSMFMTFSASISASICSSIFDGKWLPKWFTKLTCGGPYSRPSSA